MTDRAKRIPAVVVAAAAAATTVAAVKVKVVYV